MGARDESVELLLQGLTPGQISAARRVTLATTLGYLREMVGAGRIRSSDIYLSIPLATRELVEKAVHEVELSRPPRWATKADVAPVRSLAPHLDGDDVQIALIYGPVSNYHGELYELVRALEVALHDLVRGALRQHYGPTSADWWVQGVPLPVRKACAALREELNLPESDIWGMTTFINLKEIIESRWGPVFECVFAAIVESKKSLLADLMAVNAVRNALMHPVRSFDLQEHHFDQVRALARDVADAATSLVATGEEKIEEPISHSSVESQPDAVSLDARLQALQETLAKIGLRSDSSREVS